MQLRFKRLLVFKVLLPVLRALKKEYRSPRYSHNVTLDEYNDYLLSKIHCPIDVEPLVRLRFCFEISLEYLFGRFRCVTTSVLTLLMSTFRYCIVMQNTRLQILIALQMTCATLKLQMVASLMLP